jgi:hypothetical protein
MAIARLPIILLVKSLVAGDAKSSSPCEYAATKRQPMYSNAMAVTAGEALAVEEFFSCW